MLKEYVIKTTILRSSYQRCADYICITVNYGKASERLSSPICKDTNHQLQDYKRCEHLNTANYIVTFEEVQQAMTVSWSMEEQHTFGQTYLKVHHQSYIICVFKFSA